MAQQDPAIVGRELVEAFNAGDWDRFRATLTPAVVYEESGTGRRVEGADAYIQLCQGWREGFPDGTGTLGWVAARGDTAALEVVWTGTHTGPLVGPAGTMPPSQRRIEVRATLWLQLAGDRAREVHHHLDMLTMLQQLGAIPAPA